MNKTRFIVKYTASVVVDAALTLPIFILCMVLVINCIIQTSYESKLYAQLAEDTTSLSLMYQDIDDNNDYMIHGSISEKYNVYVSIYYRPFIGESDLENSNLVYVFKKSGKKYHYEGCSTMDYNSDYSVITISEAVDLGYEPCKLCSKDGIDYFKKNQ